MVRAPEGGWPGTCGGRPCICSRPEYNHYLARWYFLCGFRADSTCVLDPVVLWTKKLN